MTAAPEKHLIKKYANRKLYDTRTSHYITLDEIAQLVRDGHEIKVVDRDDGSDLTKVTLSQIMLSEEKRGPAGIVDAGSEMLHDRGQALLDYVRSALNVPADLRNQGAPARGCGDDGRRRHRAGTAPPADPDAARHRPHQRASRPDVGAAEEGGDGERGF